MIPRKQFGWIAFWGFIVAYFVATWTVGQISLPSLLFDEYFYSRAALWSPTDVPTANFGFTALYGLTSGPCGASSFYFCGKTLHLIFLLAIGIAIFVLTRMFVSRLAAAWLGLAALTFSSSVWAYMFIPEIPFSAFALWALVAVLSSQAKNGAATLGAVFISGALLGLASLFKVHALFVIPAFVLSFFLYSGSTKNYVLASGKSVIFVFAAIATKLSIGFVIAGSKGLTLLGAYQSGLDSILGSLLGSEQRGLASRTGEGEVPETLPQGGIFLGVGDPLVPKESFGFWDVATMTLDRFLALASILAIAFTWVALSYFVFEPKADDPKQIALDRIQKVLLIVVANLVALSVAFNVFVTVGGDDHSERVLFRYVEYALIPLVLISALRILFFEKRAGDSRWLRLKWPFLAGVAVIALIGNQSGITASYADSSFVPSMGEIYVWLPIFILTVATVIAAAARNDLTTRKISVIATVGSFSVVGLLAHLDFAFPDNPSTNARAVVDYIVATDLPKDEVFQVVRVPQDAGKVSTLLSAKELNYGLAFGSNPVSFDEMPAETEQLLSIGGPFFDLRSKGVALIESTTAFEHFEFNSSQASFVESLEISPLLLATDFEFYSQGAFYTEDGDVTISIDEDLVVGQVVSVCLTLPSDLQDRTVNIFFDKNLFQAQVLSSIGLSPDCIGFEITRSRDSTEIRVESNVISNLTETGKSLSTVGVGIASIDIN